MAAALLVAAKLTVLSEIWTAQCPAPPKTMGPLSVFKVEPLAVDSGGGIILTPSISIKKIVGTKARLYETVCDRENTLDAHFPSDRGGVAYFLLKKVQLSSRMRRIVGKGIL